MLTVDLVNATRRGDRLHVARLSGKRKKRAIEIAAAVVATIESFADADEKGSRGEIENALDGLEVAPRDRKLLRGLARLALQRCEFDVAEGPEPRQLRIDVFESAARARHEAGDGRIDRGAIIGDIATRHGIEAAAVESSLFADLKSTHRLVSMEPVNAENLAEQWELGQRQAVLLRATRVVVDVFARDATVYRRLFARLKFRRLLWQLKPLENGYRLTIDGPFSLFTASTRYGLALALLLPALHECDKFELRADVLWGKNRRPLKFHLDGKKTSVDAPLRLSDDVQRLIDGVNKAKGSWAAYPAEAIYDLPGVGLCVPDVRLEHPEHGVVHVEVLGYWSRDAVWKRVELVQAGLAERVIFCASTRLRVSQDVLPDDVPSALHVYKGVIHAKLLLSAAEDVASR